MAQLREVVVVDAVRSAMGKSGRKGMDKGGQLKEASAQDLLANTMRGLLDRVKKKCPKFDEKDIEDVIVGCLSQIGEQGLNIGRVASLLAGIPKEAAGVTVNRYCNAGLSAINFGYMSIATGAGDVVMCSGVEIMSHYGMGSDFQVALEAKYPVRMSKKFLETGMTVPQGISAEMIAEKYNISREDMDKFGLWSQQKATKAQRAGLFADHIIPFKLKVGDVETVVDTDETIRHACLDDPEKAMEGMRKLQPAFKKDGKVTAANSSQIVDGSGAVLLMSAEKAEKLGVEPLAKIASTAVAGDDPTIMLLGPIPARKKAMARAGTTIDKIDILEPNEAFASPLLAFAKEFGYAADDPRQNPTGGAIALGHPIGASGVIYFGEMCHEMKRRNLKWGMQMICGGGGVGIATVVQGV